MAPSIWQLLAFADLSHAHWVMIQSTDLIKRLLKEAKHRTDGIAIFLILQALLRVSGEAHIERHDEWQDASRG